MDPVEQEGTAHEAGTLPIGRLPRCQSVINIESTVASGITVPVHVDNVFKTPLC